jgi:hypothetical protein
MDKICKVTITATIHDAVRRIQDEAPDENSQVRTYAIRSPHRRVLSHRRQQILAPIVQSRYLSGAVALTFSDVVDPISSREINEREPHFLL